MRRRALLTGLAAVPVGSSLVSAEEEAVLRVTLNKADPGKSRGNVVGLSGFSFSVGFGRDGFRAEGESFVGGSSLLGKFRVNAILTKTSFEMDEALVKKSGRSRDWLAENLFRNMSSIDFDDDGRGGEYGSAFIGLEPIDSKAKQPFHFGEYQGVFRWYSYAIHGTQDESRIGKRVTGGCINVGQKDLGRLVERLKVGHVVEVVEAPAGR